MIAEFKAFFDIFKQGKELANSKTWKNRQLAGNSLVAILGAGAILAKGFGWDLHLDQQTIESAGMGIAAIYGIINSILTIVTSSKVGMK